VRGSCWICSPNADMRPVSQPVACFPAGLGSILLQQHCTILQPCHDGLEHHTQGHCCNQTLFAPANIPTTERCQAVTPDVTPGPPTTSALLASSSTAQLLAVPTPSGWAGRAVRHRVPALGPCHLPQPTRCHIPAQHTSAAHGPPAPDSTPANLHHCTPHTGLASIPSRATA
jgi:hypothetical protein